MWELDHKEGWVQKNWYFWTVVLENTLESPLDCKEILPVHPKGNQSWILIGGTDVEAEALILWPPDAESWLNGKDLDAGEDWTQEEKGAPEDEMVGWHHRLDGREFERTPGDSEGQGSLGLQTVRHDWATEQHHYFILTISLCFGIFWLLWLNLFFNVFLQTKCKQRTGARVQSLFWEGPTGSCSVTTGARGGPGDPSGPGQKRTMWMHGGH